MKNLTISMAALLISASSLAHVDNIPHLDLEMTSQEYALHLQKLSKNKDLQSIVNNEAITRALKLGARLSQWITLINANRAPENAIRLTSAATRRGIPIDKPNSYSPSIIETELEKILNEMPLEMKKIILTSVELPTDATLADEEFIKHARLLDRQYQSAARYKSVDQWRSHYIQAANKDVRGFYYLNKEKIGVQELKDIDLIPAAKLDPIKDALIKICQNSTLNLQKCEQDIAESIKNNSLANSYKKYIRAAKRNWDSFFKIPRNAVRSDVVWDSNVATVPFNTPTIAKFIPYLQDNIEEEFRFGDWSMKLAFGTYADGPLLIFKPNVVPHVNRLGGNEIVMDSNQSIEEYESQWTIRHEFGHVVGLPDCYHEFYDVNLKAYVNYQLDITDLMCSRAGNMNERIFLELKGAYNK